MDGNKDDALKCFGIGKEALDGGDRTRALKFLAKARRLDPSLPIDDLLSSAGKDSDPPPPSDGAKPDAPSGSGLGMPPLRQRKASASGSSSGSGSGSAGGYTEEQVTTVRELKRKKDYYEILGVERSCSVEDVRKAYRKLSLKVHPDKNKAPGAEEAFKSVSKAFQCLSNAESRKKYDVSGSEEPVYERRRAPRHHHGAGNGFFYEGGDVDADEIFRNFFFGGGGMAPATTQFRGFSFGQGMGGARPAEYASGGFNARTLIQLLPVLLILLLNFLPSSQPVYSLSRSYPFEYRFTTEKGVNFYVRSTEFEQDYPSGSADRARLDQQVEREYFNVLSQNCRLELQRRQWGFVRETPHCDMLKQFEAAA
ncbi:chaperone protein dnaJ 49-like [Argentina anserina]|uniref:chaperone protein dnaJ 49-like n=1 Tax=Argentina anserina TaxID=57926 RepID=UPI0021768EBA|nr:chaperone protein dnaJ 49-like [Potentilla anserina]XP_050364942.1 chaperone protein dnaJ 49-like [Potentilla anserina]XP_050364953.1 chaperone protein dnaJ 49-like [Potentilla anserina]